MSEEDIAMTIHTPDQVPSTQPRWATKWLVPGFWILFICVIINIAFTAATVLTRNDTLRSQKVEIVDSSGDTVAILGPLDTEDGRVGLVIFDTDGDERAVIGIDEFDECYMVLNDTSGDRTFKAPPKLPDFEFSLEYVGEMIEFLSLFVE